MICVRRATIAQPIKFLLFSECVSHKHITFHLAMTLDPYRCWNRRIYLHEEILNALNALARAHRHTNFPPPFQKLFYF